MTVPDHVPVPAPEPEPAPAPAPGYILALQYPRYYSSTNYSIDSNNDATAEMNPTPLSDLAFHILLALGEGPSHGYAVGKEVEARSGGRLDPTTGALYQALRRLTQEGLIVPAKAPRAADARRKYFALTPVGRAAAGAEAQRLESLVRVAREKNLYPQRA